MINLEQMQTIAVCGAGTMGAGIAQVAAASGFNTVLFDVQPAMLDKARQQISSQLSTLEQKGKLKEGMASQIMQRLHFTAVTGDVTADVIIEAIVEKIDIKTALFRELAAVNSEQTIFASNTSSLSISSIAAQVPHPERVAGMHFFNPAPAMKLVEIVSSEKTADSVARLLHALAARMGKTSVQVRDTPGFIVNRVARHYYLEAMQVAAEGIAPYKTIDRLLESAGFRMGPFALMDLIGNDVNLAVTQSLYNAFAKAPRFTPSPLQIACVQAGDLGKKTGKGFYNYL
ncbi:3-hydroxyacyl-CoA dehydrogenase NAD-binding domain-containing protein [Chitinophaga sancti]|uniref:3-hydroxyacyl-CoA dehydrogenase NAD-binding domain-containing protein n=3 Tax=Chitinophaga sancti TaxID=1004 RepID=A0A1K1P2A9_9BACT|nr:3-hydroxyacyl-CoA dehydrogenase NAD-binding domain-containing protein [Chitinophaga sancti]WQD60408.1 3-hydroxyacyl-CoA dehydrogenase NAD-binding domain-containing protein [Chitinophaga sancti]WQG87464.1 3-hydroxyacyl-CoA dehydrogenase NAD-binding domain-containing protein [Chitinophaga sancti]SFW41589.1 3-hydroxybutyryl-CoA dehydrogenase [Chitinophaga sancti]